MNVEKLLRGSLVAAALIATTLVAARAQAQPAPTVTLDTSQTAFTPGIFNQGWWDSDGNHFLGQTNYAVGNDEGETIRNFFTFDASRLTGCATGATLKVPVFKGSGDLGLVAARVTYVLHDVVAPAVQVNTNTTDGVTPIPPGTRMAIFGDLGSGPEFGRRAFPTFGPYHSTVFTIDLNVAALHALNAAIRSDTFFSIGGMLVGEHVNTFLFGNSGFQPGNLARLVVTHGACS